MLRCASLVGGTSAFLTVATDASPVAWGMHSVAPGLQRRRSGLYSVAPGLQRRRSGLYSVAPGNAGVRHHVPHSARGLIRRRARARTFGECTHTHTHTHTHAHTHTHTHTCKDKNTPQSCMCFAKAKSMGTAVALKKKGVLGFSRGTHGVPTVSWRAACQVLCGSRKFPSKEPFVELLKGSLQAP